ncbi:MAG: hypothetical protein IJU94_05690 [Clostridia bacterium]|nr:hypothetical protein [Clostridia bacterium]
MDEEKTVAPAGGNEPGSQTSTFRRVLALAAVAVLLIVGVAVIPMFLAGKQADINRETQASNASYSAAAELRIKAPAAGMTDAELGALTADSELLRDVSVKFDIPFDKGNERAVLFFPSADVSVESEGGKLEKTTLSEGILIVWTNEESSGGKLNVSEGAKNYVVTLEKGENDSFSATVSAVND